jgi:hypothetical protein
MLNNQWKQWLRRISMNHPTSARRRMSRRRPVLFDAPAEVLESRQLLSGTPFLAFAVQPSNAIAGHGLSFTVDVMIDVKNRFGTFAEIDTAYNGGFTGVPNGPQGQYDGPYNDIFTDEQNLPISFGILISRGVGKVPSNTLALDTAGTYTVTVTAPVIPNLGAPGVPGSATSNPFTISPFTSTDHLVFLNVNGSDVIFVGVPFSVTVAVEDQYGNIDTSISNVPVTLQAVPGTTSTATLNDGEATFNGVFVAGAGQDVLLANAVGGPNGYLFGFDVVTGLPLPTGT